MKIHNIAFAMLLVTGLLSTIGCAGRGDAPWASTRDTAIASNIALEWELMRTKAYNKLGIARLARGDVDGAIAAHKKVIDISPHVSVALKNWTIALLVWRDLDGAIAAQKKVLKMKPEISLAYNNLGGVLQTNGDLDGAIAAYKKAIELTPKFTEAYGNLAAIYRSQKDYDSAWKIIGAARSNGLGKGIAPKFLKDLEKDSGHIER